MPKVLISDSMSNVAQKIFEKNNISVDVKTGLSEEEIIKIIPDYDGMVVRSATKVTKNILEAAKNLKVIGRAGAGVDNIDVPTAKEKNMIVMNTPGGNANATAEHAFALIMSATPPSEPSITGRPYSFAIFFAWILSPIIFINFEDGPINLILLSSNILAKFAFSDRNP